ncbi:hypothetical protein DYBT9275_01584 [Dyadobacter sp. CECT 9275]|uniref:Uncharacterized protein n=1 Tax=Dyadobacter helix TaxID=2822344 RepID=A0A916JAU8_9BACT|nr:hypothetical protein DYBT9275_01584 [Dyadobacter sp. CECT 9275]
MWNHGRILPPILWLFFRIIKFLISKKAGLNFHEAGFFDIDPNDLQSPFHFT